MSSIYYFRGFIRNIITLLVRFFKAFLRNGHGFYIIGITGSLSSAPSTVTVKISNYSQDNVTIYASYLGQSINELIPKGEYNYILNVDINSLVWLYNLSSNCTMESQGGKELFNKYLTNPSSLRDKIRQLIWLASSSGVLIISV